MTELLITAVGKGVTAAVQRLLIKSCWKLLTVLLPRERLENALLVPNHRGLTRQWFEATLRSGEDVLLVSIMSRHTLKEIEAYYRDGKIKVRRLRVLTLAPDVTKATIQSLFAHLGESVKDDPQQIAESWQKWKELERTQSTLEVRGYVSIPTLQGVVRGNESANIELMTYHTSPSNRASLFVEATRNRTAFKLFHEAFEELWNDTKE